MSRSRKKCFYTISKRCIDNVHSVARRKVKEALNKMNPKDPEDDEYLISDADVKELGLEDWGTKMGLEFHNLKESGHVFTEEEMMEHREEGRRK